MADMDKPRGKKIQPERVLMSLGLIFLAALVVLSILGAFHGAEWAGDFFQSEPLIVFWLGLTVLLTGAIVWMDRLQKNGSLMLLHGGCVLILLGSMWGSEKGHELAGLLWGEYHPPKGYVAIFQGQTEDRMVSSDFMEHYGQLPFQVRLNRFWIDYYQDNATLWISDNAGQRYEMPAREGAVFQPVENLPQIRIVRVFTHFRLGAGEAGERQAYNDPDGTENPALDLEFSYQDGRKQKRYVFERFPEFQTVGADGFQFQYILQAKDYFSDIEILDNGQVAAKKVIEVNHPLHYGGYYLYQHSYDSKRGRYTILQAASDQGRGVVFVGYGFLVVGALWCFWGRPVLRWIKRKKLPLPRQQIGGAE